MLACDADGDFPPPLFHVFACCSARERWCWCVNRSTDRGSLPLVPLGTSARDKGIMPCSVLPRMNASGDRKRENGLTTGHQSPQNIFLFDRRFKSAIRRANNCVKNESRLSIFLFFFIEFFYDNFFWLSQIPLTTPSPIVQIRKPNDCCGRRRRHCQLQSCESSS